MEPYFADDMVTLYLGDCREVLAGLADESVDAVCCDPPYELGFMGRSWDASGIAFDSVVWRECLRVLKPGGHLVAFGGTRTWHRLAVAIEDAGLELRDTLMWVYGSGFPKSLDVSKAIDKAAGATREAIAPIATPRGRIDATSSLGGHWQEAPMITGPATEDAARWSGWGTALKPGWEPIILARKPLDGTVAANVVKRGTGALNIDACRVPHNEPAGKPYRGLHGRSGGIMGINVERHRKTDAANTAGRWPTNLVFTHSPECVEDGECVQGCPVAELDRQGGITSSKRRTGARTGKTAGAFGAYAGQESVSMGHDDEGGASRFFPTFRYEAKAPSSERPKLDDGTAHNTVKPLALMRFLARLITPPGGTVLDPFAGSGTTGEACVIEGFRSVLVELDPAHAELITARLTKAIQPSLDLFAEMPDGL